MHFYLDILAACLFICSFVRSYVLKIVVQIHFWPNGFFAFDSQVLHVILLEMKLYYFQMSFFPHAHVFLLDEFFSCFSLFFDISSIFIVFILFYFIFTPFLAPSQIVPSFFKNQAKIIMLTFYSTKAKEKPE